MADYGASDTSTTTLGTNQFPISEVYVPNGTQTAASGGTLTALEGGPASTDSTSPAKRSAPASMYVKDGNDVAQGTTTDSPNANTVVGQLKQIQTNTNGSATAANQTTANISLSSVATNTSNTATNTSNINVATGAKADSAATDSTSSWSIIALLKGIYAKLAGTLGISGTVTVQALTGTALAADQTNSELRTSVYGKSVTAGDTAIAVDVSGNVGTNVIGALPTGANNIGKVNIQASGTSLAADNTNELRVSMYVKKAAAGDTVLALGQSTMANSVPVAFASDQGAVPVTANAGTNLNTSLLALESGGNLASAKTDLDNISTVSGATTDAAVVGDNTGSISAKLRGVTKILNDIWDSANHLLHFNLKQYNGTAVGAANPVFIDGAAQQGPISVTVTSPLTLGQDNTITFASKVRTVQLHNQSVVNVPYEHDQAASAVSPYLAPGQMIVVDIHTTVLHVFPSNALPVNAASGLIVRGWA